MIIINIAQIRQFDTANGVGIRTTLFVSGCTHNCKSCFNQKYKDFEYGRNMDFEQLQSFIDLGKHEYVNGYSILGGEPFQQNPFDLFCLLREIKRQTDKTIWLWTGYVYDYIPKQYLPLLQFIDVIIDGPFIESQKDLNLKFRGSSNQRIIDVQKTLQSKKIVIFHV